MKIFSSIKNTLPLALFATVGIQCYAATNVLVIDEGADLAHAKLSGRALHNTTEKNGQVGVDDDNNGFVDDSAGWNNVSNDANFFPLHVRQLFQINRNRIAQLFSVYSRIEMGDSSALNELRNDPFGSRILSGLVGFSHGTHVAGIIAAEYKKETPFLQSFNVFTPSKDDPGHPDDPTTPTLHSTEDGVAVSQNLIRLFAKHFFDENDFPIFKPASPGPSVFDNINNFEPIVKETTTESTAKSARLRQYLRSHPQGVANLSLGFNKDLYIASLNEIWKAELSRRSMPAKTPRTPAQEAVLSQLADKLIEINKSLYSATFSEFPNVLFVVAAGNDGANKTPNAGNNDIKPVWPANFSKDYPNVITIAAVDNNGTITDFSNHGAVNVNLAAPGKAILSTAPANLELVMSGTSMAAPYVAGVAARLRTLNPNLTAAQVRKILEKTGQKNASLNGKCSTGAAIDSDAAAQAAISARDFDVDQAIESTIKSRHFFHDKHTFLIQPNIVSDTLPQREPSQPTPAFVRNMIQGVFYK